MTIPVLQAAVLLYVAGIVWLNRQNWLLLRYVWSAFGLAFLIIELSIFQDWHTALAAYEAQNVHSLMALVGITVPVLDRVVLLVPDPTGWSSLRFGIECSTLIELSVLAGLLLFYPRLPLHHRWLYLGIGIVGTYVLNLIRVVIIVLMIGWGGKPLVPVAHAIVGRLVYFVGVIGLYWFLLTRPTLLMIRRSIEVSGRAVR